MRIIFLDNTNNVNYELALALAQLKNKCCLVLFQPGLLHDPRSFDRGFKFKSNLKTTDLRKFYDQAIIDESEEFVKSFREVISVFKPDIAIINGIGLGLTKYLNCSWIIKTTGSDIHYWPNPNLANMRSESWDRNFKKSKTGAAALEKVKKFAESSEKSILLSKGFLTHPPNYFPETDRLLESLETKLNKKINRSWTHPVKFYFKKFNIKIKKLSQLTFLNAARLDDIYHTYGNPLSLDNKGTIYLLNAIYRLKKDGYDFRVIFFSKGNNISGVKNFIDRNNLIDRVIWKNPVSYKNLCYMMQSQKIQVILDSVGTSCIGKISIMGYLSGKLVIANSPGEDWKYRLETVKSNPFLHAHTQQTLYDQMKKLIEKGIPPKTSIRSKKINHLKLIEDLKAKELNDWINSLQRE